jgi:DNA-binding HxlR family transcriptional regulator
MQRIDFSQENCPIARTLDLVGEWWSLLIIREAFLGVTRYDDFQRRLGISRNALTDRLRKLVEGGVLARRPVTEGARREEYVLTEMGGDLVTVVVAMLQWGDRWLILPGAPLSRMVETATGHPVARLEVTSGDGRRLSPAELGLASNLSRADPA